MFDPWITREATEVHPHPMSHNQFEGLIPPGRTGAGPVMIWDRGTYALPESDAFDVERLREGYECGRLSFELLGERLRGLWTLDRRRGRHGDRSKWDLRKYPDSFSNRRFEPVDEIFTSVVTGRTMREIETAGIAALRRTDPDAARILAALSRHTA